MKTVERKHRIQKLKPKTTRGIIETAPAHHYSALLHTAHPICPTQYSIVSLSETCHTKPASHCSHKTLLPRRSHYVHSPARRNSSGLSACQHHLRGRHMVKGHTTTPPGSQRGN